MSRPAPLPEPCITPPPLAACLRAWGHSDAAIEDVWLFRAGERLHLDLHRARDARAVVVFQPGSGSYARFYCGLGERLAAIGMHLLGIDRPGHGFSDGPRGHCTVPQALDVSAAVLDFARREFGLPVILLGSSMGGLLTGFAVIAGQRPDLAIAHNFLIPGRLISMRLRARWIAARRQRPYPLRELVHGFAELSRDDMLRQYLRAEADPRAAWSLSAASVASLFAHNPARPAGATAPLVVLSGERDRAIPSWASRGFLRWSGLAQRRFVGVPGAGHLLFHDHLDQTMNVLQPLIEQGIAGAAWAGAAA
ncbi:MAG TPA: alpha/beta fold hydrolase [Albitalea sp.]